jgi:hypothetical protein
MKSGAVNLAFTISCAHLTSVLSRKSRLFLNTVYFLPQCSSIHCLSLLLQWDTGSWLLAIYVLPMSIDPVTLQLRYSCNALCHVISIGTIYVKLFTLTIARRLGVSVLPP